MRNPLEFFSLSAIFSALLQYDAPDVCYAETSITKLCRHRLGKQP